MQTFLHYPEFKKCGETLDTKRHGKQRLEGIGIDAIITFLKNGEFVKYNIEPRNILKLVARYQHHPVIKMWYNWLILLSSYLFYFFISISCVHNYPLINKEKYQV